MKTLLVVGVAISSLFVLLLAYLSHGVFVEGTIDSDGKAKNCPITSPIYVEVKNRTFNGIRSVTFDMELFKDNRSINLLTGDHYSLKKIISPFSSEWGCYSDKYISNTIGIIELDENKKFVPTSLSGSILQSKKLRELNNNHHIYTYLIKTTNFK